MRGKERVRGVVVIEAHEPINRAGEGTSKALEDIRTRVRRIAMFETRNHILTHLGHGSEIPLGQTKLLAPVLNPITDGHDASLHTVILPMRNDINKVLPEFYLTYAFLISNINYPVSLREHHRIVIQPQRSQQ